MKIEPFDSCWKCASDCINVSRKSEIWVVYWGKVSFEGVQMMQHNVHETMHSNLTQISQFCAQSAWIWNLYRTVPYIWMRSSRELCCRKRVETVLMWNYTYLRVYQILLILNENCSFKFLSKSGIDLQWNNEEKLIWNGRYQCHILTGIRKRFHSVTHSNLADNSQKFLGSI
jgi:hypothetical protein